MRLQSALEFLTTYSFLFLVMGIVTSVLFFVAASAKAVFPTQCIPFSGPLCDLVIDFTNASRTYTSSGYSTILFSFTNSQGTLINITDVRVVINSVNSLPSAQNGDGCAPNLLYPGQKTTCIAAMPRSMNVGFTLDGFYSITAKYCNSGLQALQANNCTNWDSINYAGMFSTFPVSSSPLAFSVVTAMGPGNQQIAPYQSVPAIPPNYLIIQNGAWGISTAGYAFGSSGYQNGTALGFKVISFPQSTSFLNNNNIACASPYNSLLSIAYTAIYVPGPSPPYPNPPAYNITIYTDNAMELYYKNGNTGGGWMPTFSGAAWTNTAGATQYGPTPITLTTGMNYLAVEWENTCGPGLQAISMNGLPS